jgi:hypothetical protein
VIELDTQVIGDLMVAVGDAWAQAEVADKAKGVQADLGWVNRPGSDGDSGYWFPALAGAGCWAA